jgi:hypothetical protein
MLDRHGSVQGLKWASRGLGPYELQKKNHGPGPILLLDQMLDTDKLGRELDLAHSRLYLLLFFFSEPGTLEI